MSCLWPVLSFALLLNLVGCAATQIDPGNAEGSTVIPWPENLPVYDHIVIVMEENKDYEEVIGQDYAPYINSLLDESAIFTRMFAEEHFSQGNYYWLFSGDNHNVGFVDQPPEGRPFTSPNLASQLIARGLAFKGYVENLPVDPLVPMGPQGLYARKHVPWLSFSNVPDSCTVDFSQFPQDAAGFESLPTVSFVIPNLDNDMHNTPPGGTAVDAIRNGDQWLRENLDAYYRWARDNNSLLIVTFDENDDRRMYMGLTNPWFIEARLVEGTPEPIESMDEELREDLINRTITIFAGAHIRNGEYSEDRGITHVNILRTIESMYGLPRAGAQQPNAAAEIYGLDPTTNQIVVLQGIPDDYIITDVFVPVR